MVQLSRAIVAIVVILGYRQDSMAIDVDWVLGASEVLINEGDPLEIKCTGPKEIFFTFPSSNDDSKVITSAYNTSKEYNNGYHSYIFRRDNTIYGDTGLYGCPDGFLELSSHPLFRTDHNLLYIYIQSNRSGFVEESNFYPINAIAGGTTIISCRPTSPDIKVQLLFNDKIKEDVDFNPRIGFTLKNLTLKNSGPLQCMDQINDTIFEIDYMLTVHLKQKLKKPEISEHTLQYVTRGQTLHVNCTTDVAVGISYSFNWSTPQQSDRITMHQYRNRLGTMILATSELIIRDVRYEDEGMYECSIMSMHDMQKTEKFIEVHDPDNRFMNITAQDAERYWQRYEGEKVQWVVYVTAYPPARIEWFNPKNEEITGSWNSTEKYNVKVTPTETILKINSLNIYDMGVYSLHVTNEDRMEMLNITLDVLVKPLLMLRMDDYYNYNETAEISCDVAAFPEPEISWNFIGCPYFPSCKDAQTVELNGITESGTTTSFRSTVRMTIKMSGYLTCSSCNSRGCDSNNGTLLVTDGVNGFGIIEPKDEVAEGDDVELICAAVVYNYTNKFEWYIDNVPVEESNRLTIDLTMTPFTHRSILKIKNVTKADSRTYTCINREAMDYPLIVHAVEKPYFIYTNLYENETTVDLNEDSGPIILKCFVGGMPKPKVTWYKDDKELKIQSKDQYLCIHDAQELRIIYLREADGGKYSCHAQSRMGEIQAYANIIVEGKAIPIGVIILIAILSITVVILVIYFTIKVRREKMIRRELMEAGLMHFEEGAVECLNPEMTVDDQAELLPYDKKFEFPRERLKLGKQLGSGAFGVVMKAEAEGICENERVTTVAVKMVRQTTDPTYVRALASELKIMVHLGKHLNVVNLLGACTKNISKRELLVIVEYCRFGNLHNYLLRHRVDFINQIDQTTRKFDPSIGHDLLNRSVSISSNNRIKYVALSFSRSMSNSSTTGQNSPMDSQGINTSPDTISTSAQPLWRSNYRGDYKDYNLKPICTQDLLSWAFQVARGMEYLSQRKVLHGDLAARNILLAEDNIVKICDFGLAKTMYKDDNYKKKGDGLLPIKWMAIESIRDRIFSTQSDIWSFGVVLWEFFTLAETPYPGMEAEKQYQKLIEGYRMEQPEYATSEVYDIMLQCWKANPTLRPSFTELVRSIGELLEDSVKMHYISLNDPYIDMNTMMLENGRSDYLQMLSAPDHTALSSPAHEYSNLTTSKAPDSAYLRMSPGYQRDESGIFSPTSQGAHFEFPSPVSDSEDAVEASPMLKKQKEEEEEDDPYLKPIDVQARRAEFVRQRQATKNQAVDQPIDRDSGYCNTPRNLPFIELNEKKENDKNQKSDNGNTKKDFIITTKDNYINIPKQKSDLRLDVLDGFSNPSYLMMTNNDQKI